MIKTPPHVSIPSEGATTALATTIEKHTKMEWKHERVKAVHKVLDQ